MDLFLGFTFKKHFINHGYLFPVSLLGPHITLSNITRLKKAMLIWADMVKYWYISAAELVHLWRKLQNIDHFMFTRSRMSFFPDFPSR